ncbi:MAG: hypothetical protein IID61_17020 [SAR324 cluster bacterium]|nr:hypothetical protein [SAR324 cluster bacterium]
MKKLIALTALALFFSASLALAGPGCNGDKPITTGITKTTGDIIAKIDTSK